MVSPAVSAEAIRGEVAELLGVGVEAIDPEGNLIGQGLDSIRMMALAGRWRRRGSRSTSPRWLPPPRSRRGRS